MVVAIIILSVLLFVSMVFNVLLGTGTAVFETKAKMCDTYKDIVKMQNEFMHYMEKEFLKED